MRIYLCRIKPWMFYKSTPNFDLMKKLNNDDPISAVYRDSGLYFAPIRRTPKCAYGILFYSREGAGQLLSYVRGYGINAMLHDFPKNLHYSGTILNNAECWIGLLPFSAVSSSQDVTDTIPEMDVPDHILPRLRRELEVGGSGEEQTKDVIETFTGIFHVTPNKSETDYKFTVELDVGIPADTMLEIKTDLTEKFGTIWSRTVSTIGAFRSVGCLDEVRDKYSEPQTFYSVKEDTSVKVAFEWDLPEGFSLAGMMLYDVPEPNEVDSDYDWKTVPFSYQEFGIEYGLSHDRFLLCDSQGLGKSMESETIAAIRKEKLGYEHCLVVCCVNTLKWNWVNEVRTHTCEDAHVLGSYTKRDGTIGYDTKRRIADLDHVDDLPYFLITNIEFLRDADAVKKMQKLIEKGKINMMIVDEIHKCKNPHAKQARGLLKLRPECRIAMTGTPIMNNPLDVYVYLRWLGFENHSFSTFRDFYTSPQGSLRNLKILDENLDKLMLRRTKEDVLDLPPKTYENQIVELSDRHQKLYQAIEDDTVKELNGLEGNDIESRNPLSMLLHLRQCTLDPSLIDESLAEPSEKFTRALDLIQNALSNNESVVVFCTWKKPLYHFRDFLALNDVDAGIITGDTKDQERMAMVTKFQKTEEPEVMLGTTGALGTGVTLTKATTVIFLDEPWTEAAKEQAVDRCYRIGTKSHVTIYTLMAKDTIDERVHELLFYKKNVSDAVIDKKAEARFLLGENSLLDPEDPEEEAV